MIVPDLGMDLVTALRVGTMLVFITVFVGIVAWMFRPGGGGRACEAEAAAALRDDSRAPGDAEAGR